MIQNGNYLKPVTLWLSETTRYYVSRRRKLM